MLEITAQLASRRVDVELTVAEGETLAILGPNGAGKSSVLATIAGLLRPDAGTGTLRGTTLYDQTSNPPAWVPPHARGVALMAQRPLLFPHLTVRDNVAFGPVSGGAKRAAARETAMKWLAEVDASDLAARRPVELSGGQAQRVAVARALAAEPTLLLLDEPMAALDITVAPVLRAMLRRVLAGRTAIIVTHDILDAYTLADRVAVMEAGRIVEIGPTRDVFERPRTPFTAALVGLNLFTGVRTAEGLRTAEGIDLRASAEATAAGSAVAATVAPSAIRIDTSRPDERTAPATMLETVVTQIEPRGDLVRVRTPVAMSDISVARVAELQLVPGTRVWVSIPAAAVRLYEV
jgi:molybdate transport system ATP-binding protein